MDAPELTPAPQPQPAPTRGKAGLVVFAAMVVLLILVLSGRRRSPEGPESGPQESAPPIGAAESLVHVEGAANGVATVTVATQPAGATVVLNGRLVGATPVTLDGVAPGRYAVRLEKNGCKPLNRYLEVGAAGLSVEEKLEDLPTGSLTVDVQPLGAEVLLDGELVGNTPLKDARVATGSYELLIRKTNYDAYSRRIEISAEEPQVFAGFVLKDKVQAMLEGQVKAEPQRLAHYVDLAHYLFVNDRLEEAADVFLQGQEIGGTPLDLDGPGFPGAKNMSEEERALELRLRGEDLSRYKREIEKHRSWPRKDTKVFRARLEQGEVLLGQKNIGTWSWVDATARYNIGRRNYERAIELYKEHIAGARPDSRDLPQAYVALMEVHLMLRDLPQAEEVFKKFQALYKDDGAALLSCGAMIYQYNDRFHDGRGREKSRQQVVLDMAEQVLRRALELAKEKPVRAQCLSGLGSVLAASGRAKDAVPLFQESVKTTDDPALAEDRSLRLADALRKAECIADAEALYNKLAGSQRASIRESAKTGLVYVAADKIRLAKQPGK
jgi:tetratricopeptide (TPR) repeat protein